MTDIECIKGLFSQTAALTRDVITKGDDDISMDLACRFIWYLHGLTAAAKLVDCTCANDHAIVQEMQDELKQLETKYEERRVKRHETIL